MKTAAFKDLKQRIAEQRDLLEHVRRAMPSPLAEHCRYCVARDERLVIFTDHPGWSFQIRFRAHELLTKLKASTGEDFRLVQARVLEQAVVPKVRRAIYPSARALSVVQKCSETVVSAELGAALSRLAATMQRLVEQQR